MPDIRYPCPCCGYRTYLRPAGGTMQICPVCFWEDAPGDYYWNGSNQVSLDLAQRNFRRVGACEINYINSVRAPLAGEERPSQWISYDDCSVAIKELIARAYRDVKLDGGATLHQREAIDAYGSKSAIAEARQKDPETRWQDIPASKIDRLGMSLIFLDPRSIRFHLPSFMRRSLDLWLGSPGVDDTESLVFGLMEGPRSTGYFGGAFLLLDRTQLEAVAAYLNFLAAGYSFREDAAKALAKGWAEWIPASFPFPTVPIDSK